MHAIICKWEWSKRTNSFKSWHWRTPVRLPISIFRPEIYKRKKESKFIGIYIQTLCISHWKRQSCIYVYDPSMLFLLDSPPEALIETSQFGVDRVLLWFRRYLWFDNRVRKSGQFQFGRKHTRVSMQARSFVSRFRHCGSTWPEEA